MSNHSASTSSKPRVDVIVPVHNAAPYLVECLQSILSQEGADLRVIAVDDCSTDDSASILQHYSSLDPRLQVLANPSNLGPGATRNLALEASTAPWLVFVDSDDTLAPGAVRQLLDIQQATGAEVVQGLYVGHGVSHRDSSHVMVMTGTEACDMVLYREQGMHPSACAGLYSARLWKGVGFPVGILYEDLAKVPLVMASAAKVAYIPRTIYHYRDTPGSILNTFSSKRLDVLQVTRILEERLQNSAARQRRFSAAFNMLTLLLRHDRSNRAAIAECCAQIQRLRLSTMRDRRVRPKVRLGAAVALLGTPVLKFALLIGNYCITPARRQRN